MSQSCVFIVFHVDYSIYKAQLNTNSFIGSVSWNTGAVSPFTSTESKQKHQNQTKPRFMHEFEILMCNLRGIFFWKVYFRSYKEKYILATGGHANAAAGNFGFNFVLQLLFV